MVCRVNLATMTHEILASDHAGHGLRTKLAGFLREEGHIILDLGPSSRKIDYPDFGHKLALAMKPVSDAVVFLSAAVVLVFQLPPTDHHGSG